MIKISKFTLMLLLISTFTLLVACQSDLPELTVSDNPDAIPIGVSASPQQYLVERIGGEHVAVSAMLPLGDDPVTYTPSEKRMRAFGKTAVFFYTALPTEKNWLTAVQSEANDTVFVDLRDGLDLIGDNPYIWLTPQLVQQQAQTIYDNLITIDPVHQADYQANFDELTAELDKLGADMDTFLSPVAGKLFIASNPTWAYFADEYGLEMHAIATINGTPASDARLDELTAVAEENNLDIIFVQSNSDDSQAKALAMDILARPIPLNPFHPGLLDNMRSTALLMAAALEDKSVE